MAPNKKKKKPASNPARGFSTVSKPSKKVDEALLSEDSSEAFPANGKSMTVAAEEKVPVALENGPSALQSMSPEELERHLERAEVQTFLDTHGPKTKRDVHRQVVRAQAERRNLRRSTVMLETESWLPEVIEEIIELSRSIPPDHRRVIAADVQPSGEDLDLKLWPVQQALISLRFGNVDGALKHLVEMVSVIPRAEPGTLWGLDEAMSWLALTSDLGDLPGYIQEQNDANTAPAFRSLDLVPSEADGETTDASDSPLNSLSNHSPSVEAAGVDPSASKGENPTNHEEINRTLTVTSSDDSDDNDPDRLTERILDARHELLNASLKGVDDHQRSERLRKRIHKIEHDVLFDRAEADARWNQIKRDLEIEHARDNATVRRQNRRSEKPVSAADPGSGKDSPVSKPAANEDAVGDDLLASMFEPGESNEAHEEADPEDAVTLLDFRPIGAGASPRRVLEDICRARDPSSKLVVRAIHQTSHSSRHNVRIEWSKDSSITSSLSFLPARLSCDFRPRSFSITMKAVAASTPSQSEGYVCTIMMFILSQSTKDEKVYLRLQTVWRDLWKELLDAQKQEIDKNDFDTIQHIHGLVYEVRSAQEGESEQLAESKAPVQELSTKMKPQDVPTGDHSAEILRSIWKSKTSTNKYQKMLRVRQQLPIWEHREEVTNTVNANQVTILCAETGAGKSTQVPSFILESRLSSGRGCNILVTQPRRISAITLAQRVSEELGEQKSEIGKAGSLVGYAIRLESKVSSSTRIRYVTTGILLRMLESKSQLGEIDCLILDEVHERTMDLDLLFIALRRLLQHRQDLKVLLMSATVDARKFSEYFSNAPILTIPGRTYPVEVKYLEDAVELTLARDNDMPGSHIVETYGEDTLDRNESERVKSLTVGLQNYSTRTRKVLADHDEYRIDYSLIANLVLTISSEKHFQQYSKAILIFMPGIGEIRRLHQLFLAWPMFQSGWMFHLLHSSFSNDDLERAFEPPPSQYRKIVIATNIAETGITIPDVTAVVDTCREKIMRFDERRQLSKLTEGFVSRSSARQRRGRAARVQPGLCFHLITRYRHDNLLLEHHVPEMLRLSLQDPILRIKVWNLGDIEQTLKEAFDPPSSKNVRRAIQLLKEVKALSETESLTSLGKQLAKLPLDIWSGKMVLFGVTFGCLDAMVFIAAMLSAKSPFLDGERSDGGAAAARIAFNRGNSDLLLVYNAYCGWRRACATGNVHDFCRKNALAHATLSQIEDQKTQLLTVLSDAGIVHLDPAEQDSLRRHQLRGNRRHGSFFAIPDRYNHQSDNDFAVNSVTAMALYPKLLVREGKGWRKVANNQQVAISPTSINHSRYQHKHVEAKMPASSSTPPHPAPAPATWLSFYQTLQTASHKKHATVFETSPVPESALAILVGNEADFRLYAGVISLDGGRVRFSVRDWRSMVAIRALRNGVQEAVRMSWRDRDGIDPERTRRGRSWLNIWQRVGYLAASRTSGG